MKVRTVFKKFVALFVAFVIALGVAGGSFSEVAYAGDYPGADMLKKFGFIDGNEKGDLMVDDVLDRAQACTLLASLHGEKEIAEKYDGEIPFEDVGDDMWYAPYVGYAASKGWFEGYSDGLFHPGDAISVQMWAALLLRILDQYQGWDTAIADLSKIGVKIYAENPVSIKRGEAFDAMWAAVNKPKKGQTISLGEELGKLQPKDSKILSAGAISLKAVEIFVNAELDPAAAVNPGNYIFVDQDDRAIPVDQIIYSADKNRLIVVFGQIMKDGSKVRINKLDVPVKKGGALKLDGFGEVVMTDDKAPEILSVESLGTLAIKVVFSEGIANKNGEMGKNDFIFDQQVLLKSVKLYESDTVAIIEFESKVEGNLGIYPQKSIKDYSGHSLIGDRIEVEMKKIPEGVGIKDVVSVSPTKVVLRLTRPIEYTSQTLSFYTATGKENGIVRERTADGVSLSGDLLTLSFEKSYLAVKENVITIKSGAFSDYSGLTNNTLTRSVYLEPDLEPAKILGDVRFLSQKQVRVCFDEPLRAAGTKLLSKENYKLYRKKEDGTNTDVSSKIVSVTYDSSKYGVVIELSEGFNGSYRLEFGEVTDISGNVSAPMCEFYAGDVEPPAPARWTAKVYNQGEANQVLRIWFDEPMAINGQYSVLDPANYMVSGYSFEQFVGNDFSIDSALGDTVVEIRYPGSRYGGVDFGSSEYSKLVIARVADRAGNQTAGFTNTVYISKSDGMEITSAEIVGANTLRIRLKEELRVLDPTDFVIEEGIYSPKKLTPVRFEAERDEKGYYLLMQFKEPLSETIKVSTVRGGSESVFGEPFKNSKKIDAVDKAGPALEKLVEGDNVYFDRGRGAIVLVFNEAIDERVVSLLSFEVPGVKVDNIIVKGKEIHIYIASGDISKIEKGQLVIQKTEIRDMAGNATEGINTAISYIK